MPNDDDAAWPTPPQPSLAEGRSGAPRRWWRGGPPPRGRQDVEEGQTPPARIAVAETTGDDPFGPGPESIPRTLYSTDSPYLEPTAGGANFHFVSLQTTKNDASVVWHRTETVDMNVLLGGELILMLDKGETTLQPGYVVIQRNTNHAWKNPSDAPAYWVAVLVPIAQEL